MANDGHDHSLPSAVPGPQGTPVTVDEDVPPCHYADMGHQKGKTPTNIYLPDDVRQQLRRASFDLEVSASVLVEGLIRRHLAEMVKELREKAPSAGHR